ncbi:asparaginase [Mycena floridula]|nr:asparaginase [Mycena floridula]
MKSPANSTRDLLPAVSSGGKNFVLVLHGGAGTMTKATSTPEQIAAYHAGLRVALLRGYEVLENGGEALDATVAAVSTLEDNPLFNAGKGAVFNVDGKNELEASIMLSKPPSSHPDIPPARRGIGLTLLTRIRNPSQLVKKLYLSPEVAPHTFLSGNNVEHIAESLGEELVDPSYFFTVNRWREHRRELGLPEEPLPYPAEPSDPKFTLDLLPRGTVGAVALDIRGCISALTSTGGRTNKLVGRIGDTPMMAAGFWAEEWTPTGRLTKIWSYICGKPSTKAVGISGTGDGDYFIRRATASTIARRMKFKNQSLKKACSTEVQELLRDGGVGGVIGLDEAGNVAMELNCPGMYRGVIRRDGVPKTAIFDDDVLS